MSAFVLALLVVTDPTVAVSRIAVMPAEVEESARAAVPRLFDDLVLTAVHALGGFEVIGQDDINALLSFEKQKDLLACGDTSCFAELGGALGVDKLLILKVARVGDEWVMTAKLINLRAARVEQRKTVSVRGEAKALIDAVPGFVAETLGGKAPPPKAAEPVAITPPPPTKVPEPVAVAPPPPAKRPAEPTPAASAPPPEAPESAGPATGRRAPTHVDRRSSFAAGLRGNTRLSEWKPGLWGFARYLPVDFLAVDLSVKLSEWWGVSTRVSVFPVTIADMLRPVVYLTANYGKNTKPKTDGSGNTLYDIKNTGYGAGVGAGLEVEIAAHLELEAGVAMMYSRGSWVAQAPGTGSGSGTDTFPNVSASAAWRF